MVSGGIDPQSLGLGYMWKKLPAPTVHKNSKSPYLHASNFTPRTRFIPEGRPIVTVH
jgi:hypothetical protein